MTFTNFAFYDPFASSSFSLVRKRWDYDDVDEHNRPTKRVRSSTRIRRRRARRAPANAAAIEVYSVIASPTSVRPLLIPPIFRMWERVDLYYGHEEYGQSVRPEPHIDPVSPTVPSPMEDVETLATPASAAAPPEMTDEEYAAVCAAASAQMLEFSSPSPSPPSSAPAFICPGASSPGWVALCDAAGPSLYAACDDDGDMEISEVEGVETQQGQPASADSDIGAGEKELVESRVDKGKAPAFVPELVLILASPSSESPVLAQSIDPALLFTAFQQPAPVQDVSEAGPSGSADKNVESATMSKGIRMTVGSKKETSSSAASSSGRKKGKENVRLNAGTRAATAATGKTKRVPFANVLNTSSLDSSAIPKPPVAVSPKTHVFVPSPALPPFVAQPSETTPLPASSGTTPSPARAPIQHMLFRDRPALVVPRSPRGVRASSSAGPAVVVEIKKEVTLEAKVAEAVREVPAPAAVVAQTKLPGGVLRRISGLFSSWL